MPDDEPREPPKPPTTEHLLLFALASLANTQNALALLLRTHRPETSEAASMAEVLDTDAATLTVLIQDRMELPA